VLGHGSRTTLRFASSAALTLRSTKLISPHKHPEHEEGCCSLVDSGHDERIESARPKEHCENLHTRKKSYCIAWATIQLRNSSFTMNSGGAYCTPG
jgi:hypothetical protein